MEKSKREKRAVYQPTLFQETCEMDLMEKAWIWETIGTNPARSMCMKEHIRLLSRHPLADVGVTFLSLGMVIDR